MKALRYTKWLFTWLSHRVSGKHTVDGYLHCTSCGGML